MVKTLPVKTGSAWDAEGVAAFLGSAVIPMRVAVNDPDGFPRLCSLWFLFDGERLLAASHRTALVSRLLQQDNRCAFEIATNTEPYRGVRGQGRVQLVAETAADTLPRLIDRYIGDRHQRLQRWLMSRVDEEYTLSIKPIWLSAWDYSGRMKDAKAGEHAI